jgi:transcriptional antiterminator RfaH
MDEMERSNLMLERPTPHSHAGGRSSVPTAHPQIDEPAWMEQAPGRWWVIHTRARNEKAVAAALERCRIRYYLPLIGVRHTYAKAKVTFRLPLFPGYLFLCGNEDERDVAWRTNRVANVLEVEDQEQLRAELTQVCRVVESGEAVALYPALRAGQRCRVTDGPLRDLEGVVIRHGRQWRMYLSVTMLGQSAIVEVDAARLEAID